MLRTSLWIALLVVMFSCKDTDEKTPISSFTAFYEQFHNDTSFQMDHIIFPLSGVPEYSDSIQRDSGTFKWQKEHWILHKSFEAGGFKRTVKEVGAGMVIETIIHEQAKLGMERRFAYLHDGWYLIYYAGLNPIK